MAEPIDKLDFLKKLNYKPTNVGNDDIDDVSIISFRGKDKMSPYIEYGKYVNKKRGGQYFYFEILDMRNYVDGAMIPLDADIRKHVIYTYLNAKNADGIASKVNSALKLLHSGKLA